MKFLMKIIFFSNVSREYKIKLNFILFLQCMGRCEKLRINTPWPKLLIHSSVKYTSCHIVLVLSDC